MQKLKKPVSVLLTVIMIVSLFTVIPTQASAAEAVEYVFRSWDADQNKVVDHYGTCTSYTTIRSTSSALTLTSGWYVVNGNADITEHRITVSGEVHLILLSGTMDCEYGIRLSEGNSLYVYPGKNSSGTLNARTGSDEEANIGGNESENCGEFVFYGGTLKARNNDRCSGGAAIGGGGNGGNCGTLSFYGGTVDAENSGAATAGKSYGAAIGCGNNADSGGSGCCINIYGGTITADNGSYSNGAGIGGGEDSKCAPINILGGEIEAKAYNGAAIGSGQGGTSNTITIKNAIIKKAESNFGAGIGSGEDSDCESIVIDNSYVNAYTVIKNGGTGGEGAGIGGGNCGKSKNIKITKSVIVAASGRYGAGIGGGDESDGGDTEITDSAVFACSAQGGAGIGGGDEKGCGTITLKNSFIVVATDSEQNVSAEKFINSYGDNYNTIMQSISNPAISSQAGFYAAGNLVAMMFDYIITGTHTGAGIGSGDSGTADHINIDNCTVYSVAGECAAGIGGGDEGSFVEINIKDSVIESQGGKFGAGIGTGDFAKSCGTINIESSTVTAKGGSEGAGIGSGNQIDGSPTIIINDSKVVANGGTKYAAGIGGGDAGNGGNITIKNDSNVEAYGGTDAAGIGGGEGGDGGNITIEDSDVYAEGSCCGAGIGNGEDGDETNISIYGDSRVEAYAGNSDASAIGHGDNGIFYGHHVTTTFSSELKVKAGSSDRSTTLYYGSTRHDAVWNNPYALVYLCEHENTEWWGQNSDMHELRCRDCGKWLTSREAHQWDENDVCTVCGGERRTLTLTFIEKDKNGQEVRTVKAIDGYSAYTLPECENVPDGYGFLYWKVSDGEWRDYYYPPGERLTASLVSPVAEAVYLPLKETKYIDKNGVEKTVMAKQISALETMEYLLLVTDGWYVIDQNLPILGETRCYGDVKFIVEDGCTWSERGNSRDDFLTGYHRGHSTFSLYGQKNQTGSIDGGYTRGVSFSSYTQYGANLRCYTALFEESCKIFGGGFYSYDVTAVYNGELLIDGGNCYFTGLSGDKSVAQIGWTKPTDRISFSLLEGESPIKIKDGQAFRDNNGNIYENEITLEQMAALSVGYNDKTLTPYIEHNYGEPEWVWQNEYRDATAVFRCTDAGCDDVREIKAKVKCEDSGKNRTATAYCTFNGQEYSTTQTFRIIFDITVADCENGTVTASKSTARQDEAIDLEITPDEHYVLKSLTVTDAEDNPIAVTDNTFIMPASDVAVNAVFEPDLYTVTWKNDDGAVIDTTQVLYGSTPSHASPVKESDEEYRYEFNGWYPALTPVTGDTEYTATFRAVEKSYFKGHSLSLKGDILVNFYLGLTDREIADGAKVDFVWTVDGKEKTHSVTLTSADKTSCGYKASCPIAVAEMTYEITATLTIGKAAVEADTYSAVTYANVILTDDSFRTRYIEQTSATKYNQLVTLVQTMLDYGSKAQVRFDRNTEDLANGGTDFFNDEVNIPNGASDMEEYLIDCGLEYVGTSVIYLSKTTLRHYYRIVDPSKFTDEIKNGITFDGEAVTCGVKKGMIYFDKKDIAASQLDTEYVIRINGHEYHYSALDYSALAYISDDTPYENSITKQLAAAVYRYNQAANEYFTD